MSLTTPKKFLFTIKEIKVNKSDNKHKSSSKSTQSSKQPHTHFSAEFYSGIKNLVVAFDRSPNDLEGHDI